LIVDELVVDTFPVVIVKSWLRAPAGTIRLLGTCAAELLVLVIATKTSPGAAAHSSVTVPVAVLPPVAGFGLIESDCTPMGRNVSVALFDAGPSVAVTVTGCEVATGDVVAVKVTFVVDAGTMTLGGTVTRGLSLASETVTPPEGAVPLSTTLPTESLQPATVEGVNVSELRVLTPEVRVTVLLEVMMSASLPDTVAVFEIVPPIIAVATSVMVAVAFFARLPMLQVTVPSASLQLPAVDDADTKDRPAGSGSITVTPVAGEGPRFFATRV
jgi:hypothetical protein